MSVRRSAAVEAVAQGQRRGSGPTPHQGICLEERYYEIVCK